MFLLDSLLVNGISFVLDKVATIADQELNDPDRQRERLLEAQLKLEAGEMTDEEFAAIEADVFERIREIKARSSPGRRSSMTSIAWREWRSPSTTTRREAAASSVESPPTYTVSSSPTVPVAARRARQCPRRRRRRVSFLRSRRRRPSLPMRRSTGFPATRLQKDLQDVEAISRHALAHASVVEFFFRSAPVIPLKLFTLFSSDERGQQHLRLAPRDADGGCSRISAAAKSGAYASSPASAKPSPRGRSRAAAIICR